MVEKPDFAHARARVRNLLTRFYGKAGILPFGVLAHSGSPSDPNPAEEAPIHVGTAHVRCGAATACRYIGPHVLT